MFESQLIKTDVTAAKFIGNYILAGVGDSLNVYHRNSLHDVPREKLKIFDGFRIHGIEANDDSKEKLLLFGGCRVKILKCDWKNVRFKESYSQRTKDWILASKWLHNNKGIAVTVMSNKLIIFNNDLGVQKEVSCDEKCILYSSFIHRLNDLDDLILFSGTVFSDILIWKVSVNQDSTASPVINKLKGHKGVIFSVSYNEKSRCICSSSDDRSTIVWSFDAEISKITQRCKVYGHQSRVFRSLILDELLITAGEDSYVNVWTLDGKLLRKIEAHQGGPVWALDGDNDTLLSGGGDCGLSLIPLRLNLIYDDVKLPREGVAKHVGITRNNNLLVMTEEGVLMYFIKSRREWEIVGRHEDLKSYSVLEVSKCRRLVSLSGFNGDIYIYQERNDVLEPVTSHKTGTESRIFSFHWLSCDLFITCQRALLNLWCVLKRRVVYITYFNLPKTKDLWTTTACQTGNGKYIVGDRKGNIYVYTLSSPDPVKCFNKAHSYLGVTKLYNFNDKIVSLGRNGLVKTFISDDMGQVMEISSDKVPFPWLVEMVDGLLLAFSGENVVLWDYKSRRTLLEHNCGGGHRSWDFYKLNDGIVFVYVKANVIKFVTCDHRTLYPKNIEVGFHSNTVNSLRVVKVDDGYMTISGGEDTSVRVSVVKTDRFFALTNVKSHLSSVRTIYVSDIFRDRLFFSGGGRGQIVCWRFSPKNFSCSEEYSYYKKLECEFSEVRVMDFEIIQVQNMPLLLVATSQGKIDVFFIFRDEDNKYKIDFFQSLFYKLKCVTRICAVQEKDVLMSMSTDGNLTLWDLSDILTRVTISPFRIMKIHQSGINSCSYRLINDSLLVLLTGGDDNCISLNLFRIGQNDERPVTFVHVYRYVNSWSHCAQITGTFLTDAYFLTASIDQKLIVFSWEIENDQKLICKQLSRYNSTVPDIQGMECFENSDCFDVFIYGKGLEFVRCLKRPMNL